MFDFVQNSLTGLKCCIWPSVRGGGGGQIFFSEGVTPPPVLPYAHVVVMPYVLLYIVHRNLGKVY
jgi:hypothetical protein